MLRLPTIVVWACAAIATSRVAPERDSAISPCAPQPVIERRAAISSSAGSDGALLVGSLNMAANPRIAADLDRWVRERGFDVLFLQEVGGAKMDGAEFVEALADRLGYNVVYAPANVMGDHEQQGLAILSRGSIRDVQVIPLEYHKLRFRSRCRIALSATIARGLGDVRVTNIHLDTRINAGTRVAQLAPVVALASSPASQVLGGDFNTMDVYWWRTMWPFWHAAHQADAVRAWLGGHGFQTPFAGNRSTFKFMGLPIRLDWIYLKQLDATDWSVDDVPITDHRGVWVRVGA